MCYPVPCRVCGKTTWAGCGEHIAELRAQVPPEQWCQGHGPEAAPTAPAFVGTPQTPFPAYPAPRPTNWSTYAALAVALVALAVAAAALFRPATAVSPAEDAVPALAVPSTGGVFSAQQSADAKLKVCDASRLTRSAVQFNTNMENPVPGDPAGDLAVGTNARLALSHSAQYLHNLLSKEPATPPELATAVGNYADTLSELALGYLTGHSADDSVQQPLRDRLTATIDVIDNLCPM